MNPESKRKAQNLVSKLENESMKDSIIPQSDKMINIKNETIDFINKRFEKIAEDKDFEDFIKKAIMSKIIDNPDEVSIAQLSSLLNQARMRNTEAIESILHFFKPTPGDRVPFMDEESNKLRIVEESILQGANPKLLKTLMALSELVDAKSKESETIKEVTDD